jgi:ComF family protein
MFTIILQLIYPKQCCACKEALLFGEEFICVPCTIALPRYDFREEKSNYLVEKFEGAVELQSFYAFAWFVEKGLMQSIMHQIKYKHNIPLAHFMGKKFAKSFSNELHSDQFDAIVPIPLHPKRKKERGYNQSEEIAKGISQVSNIPLLNNCLIRTKYGESLVQKNKESRFEVLNDSFSVVSDELKDKKVLLLDDTLTTGATCLAAGKKILENGAKQLSIASLAVVR